jgi:alkaline phosphatase D
MPTMIDRRSLILTGTLGLGALAIPGFTLAQTARGFTHSVASGEPAADSALLWTRYVGGDSGTTLRCEVAETPDFGRVVAGGEQTTGPWRDGTVKVTVRGLRPGRWYHYRFVAPDGTMSPVGRTRTLPADGVRTWRAAIFSCSNMGYGWFNAYGHAAARADLDCWIHLGDYFYEYAPDHYPPAKLAVPGRVPAPASETIHLADYRLRFASYRSDPDLQRLHATLPMIAQWDDHESANDSWEGGAENHDPATEGDWSARRDASVQAYREWMPVSEEPWSTYQIGGLATLFRTETRLLARTRQQTYEALLASGDPARVLPAFRDGAWRDPAMTMMGSEQERWLDDAIRASVKSGTRWQVVAFGTNMGRIRVPASARGWLNPDNARARGYVEAGIAAGAAGLPNNLDNWGGYPAARARFLAGAMASDAELIVITGDSHNAWAFDLAHEGRAAGVEFGGHSVTSPGYESGLSADPKLVARDLVAFNPELKWCDTARRGYMAMTVAADRVTNDWVFVDTVRTRTPAASVGHSTTVLSGRRTMS